MFYSNTVRPHANRIGAENVPPNQDRSVDFEDPILKVRMDPKCILFYIRKIVNTMISKYL